MDKITSISSANTRFAPRIQFVGVFDTIKPTTDDMFDLSFNRSIKNMRHAVALHEDRKALSPEYIYPEELAATSLFDQERTFVQAHFVGQHNDMGGTGKKFGLSLYPIQWMLLEAKQCGLSVDLHGGPDDPSNPLRVVFPKYRKETKTVSKGPEAALWSFKTANGIDVKLQDLREVHGLSRSNQKTYAVSLGTSKLGSIRQKKAREPFTQAGYLRGYCDLAPQVCCLHVSYCNKAMSDIR